MDTINRDSLLEKVESLINISDFVMFLVLKQHKILLQGVFIGCFAMFVETLDILVNYLKDGLLLSLYRVRNSSLLAVHTDRT